MNVSMPAISHFRFPISRLERTWRRLYSNTLRKFGVNPHVVRAQGARFQVNTIDYIDQCIAYDGMWEAPQLEVLAELCRRQKIDCFLDVGANAGFYSIMFAMKKLTDQIIAFEPDPGNYARLATNLALNDLSSRVEAVPLALGDANSEVTLYEGAKWNRGESTIAEPDQTPKEFTHRIRQTRFDDAFSLARQNIIIKMDVEGYEFHVLAGMERTLRDNTCYLQVELYSDRLEELKGFFAQRGYRYLHTEYIDHFFTNMPDIT
jgi:FkbM family methyltransferase